MGRQAVEPSRRGKFSRVKRNSVTASVGSAVVFAGASVVTGSVFSVVWGWVWGAVWVGAAVELGWGSLVQPANRASVSTRVRSTLIIFFIFDFPFLFNR